MRPTDENQSSSRRPNLMSPARRSAGEIHILAMLDGRGGGRRMRGRPALRWYGAGAVLACALLAALAWLVRGAPVRDAGPAVMAAAPPTATTPAPPAIRTQAGAPDVGTAPNAARVTEPDTTPGPRTAPAIHGAHIVDLAPPARPAQAPALPAVAPYGPARDVAVVAVAAANVPAAGVPAINLPATGVRTARPAAASGHRAPAPVPAPRSAALVSPARPQQAYRPVPHAAPSPPGTQSASHPPSLARADAPPARHKHGPAAVRAPSALPATVDTDVAVISAILQHAATGHETADVNPAAACSDKPCGPRMPSR